MSIMYCEKHDRRWDSDKEEECPVCVERPETCSDCKAPLVWCKCVPQQSIADLIPEWYEGGTQEQMLDEAYAQIRRIEAQPNAELDASIAEVRRVAGIIRRTQPIWCAHLTRVCNAADALSHER